LPFVIVIIICTYLFMIKFGEGIMLASKIVIHLEKLMNECIESSSRDEVLWKRVGDNWRGLFACRNRNIGWQDTLPFANCNCQDWCCGGMEPLCSILPQFHMEMRSGVTHQRTVLCCIISLNLFETSKYLMWHKFNLVVIKSINKCSTVNIYFLNVHISNYWFR
jgi:hypothetical protein